MASEPIKAFYEKWKKVSDGKRLWAYSASALLDELEALLPALQQQQNLGVHLSQCSRTAPYAGKDQSRTDHNHNRGLPFVRLLEQRRGSK
jgi:hypothetical protein